MRLTDRELATVLAALRFWQGEWAPTAAAPEMPDTGEFSGYFAEVEPLTEDEIDELCERLNTRPAAAAPAQDEHPNTDEHRAACVQCMTEHDAAQPDAPSAEQRAEGAEESDSAPGKSYKVWIEIEEYDEATGEGETCGAALDIGCSGTFDDVEEAHALARQMHNAARNAPGWTA